MAIGLEKIVFIPVSKKDNARVFKLPHNYALFTC